MVAQAASTCSRSSRNAAKTSFVHSESGEWPPRGTWTNTECESAVVTEDPHDGASRAVIALAPAAGGAVPAGEVDLGGDAPPEDGSEELVTEDAAKAHVALRDLEVGRADPGAEDRDERLARLGRGFGPLGEDDALSVEDEGLHAREDSFLATVRGGAAVNWGQ